MLIFRIIKEADKTYKLLRKIPSELMLGKEVWDPIRLTFSSIIDAESYAHETFRAADSKVVKEFTV